MIKLSNSDGKTLVRVTGVLRQLKLKGLKEINAVRQLQVITTKIKKQSNEK